MGGGLQRVLAKEGKPLRGEAVDDLVRVFPPGQSRPRAKILFSIPPKVDMVKTYIMIEPPPLKEHVFFYFHMHISNSRERWPP